MFDFVEMSYDYKMNGKNSDIFRKREVKERKMKDDRSPREDLSMIYYFKPRAL